MKTLKRLHLLISGFFLMILAMGCKGQATATAYENIDVQTFASMMDDENVIVFDVRTPKETAAGKIGEAIEADFLKTKDFNLFLDSLDRDKTYLVYCRSGRRSASTCKLMAGKGFGSLYNLKGGIIAWNKMNNDK